MTSATERMKNKKIQIIAAASSVTLLAGWGVYWIVQVIDVLALLEMAYG
jgi:hypothetical protein